MMKKPLALIVANQMHHVAAQVDALPEGLKKFKDDLASACARSLLCAIAHDASDTVVRSALAAIGAPATDAEITQSLAAARDAAEPSQKPAADAISSTGRNP